MNNFEKHSIIIFMLSMTGSIINYLFQIFMGRMLDVASFGIINTVSSFYAIISIPSAIILMFVSKYVSEYKSLNIPTNELIKKTFILVLLFTVIFCILGMLISGFIASYLKIDNILLINIIILAAGFGYIVYLLTGNLQGEKRFIAFGLIGLILPLTKLFGSIIFILIGLKLNGVILSFLIGNILAIIFSFFIIKIDFKITINKISFKYKSNVFKFVWAAILINIGTNILTNIDIIMVKQYFSNEVTGLYSAASILGKIIIFVASTIIFVLFPYAAELKKDFERRKEIIIKSLIYGLGLSIICVLGLNILSKYIVSILFGSKYLDSIEYIFPISIWAVIFCFIVILSNYLLAIDKGKLISYSMVLGSIIIYLLIIKFHIYVFDIIKILTIVSAAILVIGLISLFSSLNYKKIINNNE